MINKLNIQQNQNVKISNESSDNITKFSLIKGMLATIQFTVFYLVVSYLRT